MLRDPEVCAKRAVDLLDAVVDRRGGSPRSGQREACAEIAACFAAGRHVVIEAQTGTGKSLAYLAAAAAWGGRTVVSTASKSLQRQLLGSDVPALRSVLAERGHSWEGALLQGRSNYLCRVRCDSARQPSQVPLLGARPDTGEVQALLAWEGETASGDRADFPGVASPASWAAVSMGPGECPGASRCDQGAVCFAEQARERASAAQVVVCNHHLLAYHLRWGGVLPDFEAVVVDEAHDLEPVVTSALAVRLSPGRVASILAGVGVPAATRKRHAADLERALAALPSGRLRALPTDLGEVLASIAATAAGACSLGAAAPNPGDSVLAPGAAKRPRREVEELARQNAARQLITELARAIALDDADVVWGDEGALSVAPLDVGGILGGRLFATTPVALLSATLRVGGSFTPSTQRLGLRVEVGVAQQDSPPLESGYQGDYDDMPLFEDDSYGTEDYAEAEGPLGPQPRGEVAQHEDGPFPTRRFAGLTGGLAAPARTLVVDSPFDYASQGLLYLPTGMPDPAGERERFDEAVAAEILALMGAAGGRTLALFSSKAARDRAAEFVRSRWHDSEILVQGESSDTQVAAQFRSDAAACLFATLGFWQGFDVPGDSCRVVVLDRIPFSSPADVLSSARIEAAGADGWTKISLARAAILLAQGAGRLIRTVDDRGVVVVCDPRLTSTRRYAGVLQRSLPPLRRSTRREQVCRFLAAQA